jgi:hypothetical protein
MWKQVHQEEHVDVRPHLYYDGTSTPAVYFLAVPIEGLVGKHIRVTVEEEVSECCEKWRGADAIAREWTSTASMSWTVRAKFCPECGRRL